MLAKATAAVEPGDIRVLIMSRHRLLAIRYRETMATFRLAARLISVD